MQPRSLNPVAKTKHNRKKTGHRSKTSKEISASSDDALTGEVERSAVTELVGIETQASAFSGPIPSPDMLREYDELLPGTADRLISEAERESAHRRQIEASALEANVNMASLEHSYRMRGQLFGFIVAVVAIVGGIVLALKGVTGWGALLSLGGVAALVWPFISGRKEKSDKKSD